MAFDKEPIMTHRSLMFCVALSFVAGAALFMRQGAQEGRRRQPLTNGKHPDKPALDVSITSHSLPF